MEMAVVARVGQRCKHVKARFGQRISDPHSQQQLARWFRVLRLVFQLGKQRILAAVLGYDNISAFFPVLAPFGKLVWREQRFL